MSSEPVLFAKLHPDAIIPTRGTPVSAGFDLYALEDKLIVGGHGNILVPTGIAVKLPPNTYGRIAMRSGLALKQHLTVSAGVIDRDYVGPIGVLVSSTKLFSEDTHMGSLAPGVYKIKKGERFAQLIIETVSYADGIEVDSITNDNPHVGFGSTGTN